jgi:hypothetical protein
MISDAALGYLLDYFNNLMSVYFPGDMAGMLASISADTSISILISGPGSSLVSASWNLDTVGPNTALALKVQMDSPWAGAPTYVDVTVSAYVSVSDTYTVTTSDGAALLARRTLGTVSFVPVEFAIGVGGYNPYTPRQATPPNPLDTTLEYEMYRSPIERFDAPTDTTMVIVCRIPPNAGLHCALGEIGVFVQLTRVTDSTPLPGRVNTLNIGDKFMLTLTHTPMRCLTPDQTDLHRVTIAL